MAEHNDLGKQGEAIAKDYLLKNDYKILETNWQSGHAEIDILAQKDDILVVIEVKTRSTDTYGKPEMFVNKKKIRLLMNAVNHYIERHNLDLEIRFDIISIIKNQYVENLEHIEDAFYWY